MGLTKSENTLKSVIPFRWLFLMIVTAAIILLSPARVPAAASYQNSTISNWAEPVECHVRANADGSATLMYALTDGTNQKLTIKTVSASGSVTATKKVSVPGTRWGGCVFDDASGNHYVASENNGTVGWYISKFDASWNNRKTVSIAKDDSYTASAFGTCDMAMSGKYLIVHAARNRKDGHQDSITFYIDTETMQAVYIGPEWQFNHCSHSFNQFVRTSGGSVLMVDHGDAFPREICLQVYDFPKSAESLSNGYESGTAGSLQLYKIWGATGNNYTGVTVDGFELGKSADVVAGTSIPHSGFTSDEDFSAYSGGNNIYFICVKKDHSGSQLKWLTNYKDGTEIKNLKLLKINDDKFLILYGKRSTGGTETTCCMTVDSSGKKLSSSSISGEFMCTSDASVNGGKIRWCSYMDTELGNSLVMNTWDLSGNKLVYKKIDTGTASEISSIVPASGLTNITMVTGKKKELQVKVYSPVFADEFPDGRALWESNHPEIVEPQEPITQLNPEVWSASYKYVSVNLTAKKPGTAVLTCSVCDKTLKIKIKVTPPTVNTVSGQKYKLLGGSAVALAKAKNAKSVTVPAKVKLYGKVYRVTRINAKAFTGSKIRTVTVGSNVSVIKPNAFYGSKTTKVILKTKKLTKKSVKNSLKGSKVKIVKVNVNKTVLKKYKKIFVKKIVGRNVSVK